jgi:hypothetical protein
MSFIRIVTYYLLLGLVAFAVTAESKTSEKGNTPNLAILYDVIAPKLAEGSLFIYIVPVSTTGEYDTTQRDWWKVCAGTKALSEQGIQEAKTINRSLAKLNSVVGIVHSGELCTSQNVAMLVAGRRHNIYITPDLDPSEIQKRTGISDAIIRLRITSHFLARWHGMTTLLFGDGLTEASAPHPIMANLSPGETAIFEPTSLGELQLIARLNWRQWEEMANYISKLKTVTVRTIAQK